METEPNSKINYNKGDFVVYPAHGVGHVLGLENQKIGDTNIDLVVVRFDQERMTLRIPLSKAANSGLRKLSSKQQMDKAISILKTKAKAKKLMWSRRAQEYETKINSGNLALIAEVVRDLHKEDQADQSYSERQMYQSALERLAGEFAAIEDIDQSSAQTKLSELLNVA